MLMMNRLHVGQNLHTEGSREHPATFAAVNLTAAKINGQLAFSGATVSGALMMNDAHASVLHAIDFVWSKETSLHGFTYDRPPVLDDSGNGDASRSNRMGASYISWPEKDQSYSPQPYEHLAAALYKLGEPSVATDVLYAGRERARHEARRSLGGRFVGMSLLKWTMGYELGHRYFWSLGWIFLLMVVGAGVLI